MPLRVFPVAASGAPAYADAFGSHRGTDIFAPTGTPVLAVDDGNIRADLDPKGGQVTYLRTRDGAVYYYAHLSRYAGTYPRSVVAGETLGFVGTTGNAQGKDAHLHFEVHPQGDQATVDPFPLLLAVQGLDRSPAEPVRGAPPAATPTQQASVWPLLLGLTGIGAVVLLVRSRRRVGAFA